MAFPNNPTSPPVLELNSHAINTSCVGFWPLTHVSGNTASDISTAADDATGTGVQWESITAGNAYDGQGGYLQTSSFPVSNVSAFSVSAWIDNGGQTKDWLGSWLSLTGEKSLLIRNDNLQAYVRNEADDAEDFLDAGVTVGTKATESHNGLAHCVFVVDNGTATWYVNGSQTAQDTSFMAGPYIPSSNTQGLAIGNGHASEMADGNLQNVRFFNTALSADDVALLYNRPWVGTDYDETWPYSPPVPSGMSLSTDTAATSLNSGCVGWWPLTEGTGTTAKDITTNANDGTESGTVGWDVTGRGNAPDFDGVDDRFEVDDAGDFDFGTSDFSVSAWVYFDATPGSVFQFVSRGDTVLGSACWFALSKTALNVFNFIVDDDVLKREAKGSTTVTSGTWYHVVGVRNSGGTNRLYVNGVSEGNTADNGNSVSQTDAAYRKFRISSITNNGTYNEHQDGNIQNVRIWDRALSADEVTLLYERPWEGESTYGDVFPNDPPPTLALGSTAEDDAINTGLDLWWPLVDGSGNTPADISGTGDTLAATGSPTWDVTVKGNVAELYVDTATPANANYYVSDVYGTTYTESTSQSISFWARGENTSASTVGFFQYGESAKQSDGNPEYLCQFNAGEVRWYARNAYHTGISVGDNEWFHTVVTNDGTTTRMYFNGVEVSTATGGSVGSDVTNQFWLGAGYRAEGGGQQNIQMQNVRVWSRALSATEVQSLYETPWIGSNYTAEQIQQLYNFIFRSKRFRRL